MGWSEGFLPPPSKCMLPQSPHSTMQFTVSLWGSMTWSSGTSEKYKTSSLTASEESRKGKAVSKERLAHCIVEAIVLAYEARHLLCPLGVRAHSTRGVSSSWALSRGASIADICRAAGWAPPNTFARFYNLCVEPMSSHVFASDGQ